MRDQFTLCQLFFRREVLKEVPRTAEPEGQNNKIDQTESCCRDRIQSQELAGTNYSFFVTPKSQTTFRRSRSPNFVCAEIFRRMILSKRLKIPISPSSSTKTQEYDEDCV